MLNNRSVMLRLLKDWNEEVSSFVRLLESEDGVGIEEAFEEANGFRSQLPERRKGMIAPLFDLHIDVPDHPGIIGRIATELGDQGINLSNVQIIESREDVPGIMRLSFRQENDMERAKVLLQEHDYTVYV